MLSFRAMELNTPPSTDARRKLSQGNWRAIANRAGLTPQHVARVIKGTKGATLHTAADIACAADVTLDDLYKVILMSSEYLLANRRNRGVKFVVINERADEAQRKINAQRAAVTRLHRLRATPPQSRGQILNAKGAPCP